MGVSNKTITEVAIRRAACRTACKTSRSADCKSKQRIPCAMRPFPILHAEDVGARNRYRVLALVGARSAGRRILQEELLEAADEVCWATDDGSAGFHGTVVDLMRHWREQSAEAPSFAHVIGPIPLMRFAAELTRQWASERWQA
jgi:hypothetical protein